MNRPELRRELDVLLAEEPAHARVRAAGAYDELAGPHGHRLVLFGAGSLGRRMLRGLRQIGVEPLAFCDSNPAAAGTKVEGIDVLAPAEAARRFGADAVFLVTIWGGRAAQPMPAREAQLRALGVRTVIAFGLLCWKYPDHFLPNYPLDMPHRVLEARDEVSCAFDLWEDDDSRREFVAQIRWRLRLDFAGLPRPVTHEIYFPDDLAAMRSNEVFVDAGAFDGDTLATFLQRRDGIFDAALSFEPDPTNFSRLAKFREGLAPDVRARVEVQAKAVTDRSGPVRFDPTGTEAAAMGTGALELDGVSLDDVPSAAGATWIKMDIEGAEPLALAGARRLIARNAPVLAVCVYHRQAHVWEIPNLLAGIADGYASYLRPHLLEAWDLVYYGIPHSRHA